MRPKLTVYHKPTCTKCRTVLKILRDRDQEFEAIDYYHVPFSQAHLRSILKKLALSPRQILRKDEPIATELSLGKKNYSDEEIIALMVKHPDLIQRPIAVRGDQAVLARPPEKIEKLL